jgi:hypothetical protein
MVTHCSVVCGCEYFEAKYGQYAPPKRRYTPSVRFGLNFFLNRILIRYGCTPVFELPQPFIERLLSDFKTIGT